MSNVKGSAITARLRFVRERYGDAALAKIMSALPPDDQRVLEGRVLPQAWVPYELFVDLNVAIDNAFGKGDLALCYEMGRFSAGVNLPRIYKLFYRLGNPMFIFRKASRVWGLHYDSGSLTPAEDAPGIVRLRIEAFERPHRAHCLSVLGWASKSIELSGGEVTATEEDRCRTRGDPTCDLIVRWR